MPRPNATFALAVAFAATLLLASGVGQPALSGGMEEINAGRLAAEEGRLDAALDHFEQAIKAGDLKGKDLARAYNNRGNVFGALGQPKRSLQDLNRAILIDPKYVSAYYNRAITQQDLGDFELALADYNKVLELNSEHVAALFYRGVIRERFGRRRQAEEDFLKAYELAPDNITVKSKLEVMGLL